MGLHDLPGVAQQRPPRAHVPARERIDRLRAAGHPTTWYSKHPRTEPLEELAVGEACSVYHLHVAEGTDLHTAHYATGEPYAFVQPLKEPVVKRVWICLVCSKKWRTWDEAKEHCKQDTN